MMWIFQCWKLFLQKLSYNFQYSFSEIFSIFNFTRALTIKQTHYWEPLSLPISMFDNIWIIMVPPPPFILIVSPHISWNKIFLTLRMIKILLSLHLAAASVVLSVWWLINFTSLIINYEEASIEKCHHHHWLAQQWNYKRNCFTTSTLFPLF